MTYFYVKAIHTDKVTIRRVSEVPGEIGSAITDVTDTPGRLFNAAYSHEVAVYALIAARDELQALNGKRGITSHAQTMIVDALKLMNGEVI